MTQNRIRIVDVADTLGLSSIASNESNPSLTTIHQEANLRAKTAIECLEAMRDGTEYKPQIVLPVDLRQSKKMEINRYCLYILKKSQSGII